MNDLIHAQSASSNPAGYCIPDAHGRCVTCSDEVQRATVLAVDGERLMAQVAVDGQRLDVDVSLVTGVEKGQVLLVHGGVALDRERR